MLALADRVKFLRAVSFFSDAPEEVLTRVAEVAEEVIVESGCPIVIKGQLETTMYIIVSGQVQVHDDDRVMVHLDQGEVFGELSALDPAPRSASVTASAEVDLLSLNHENLMALMQERFEVAYGIIRFLCRRYRQAGRQESVSQLKVSKVLRALG